MIIIYGLGNNEQKYLNTKHNIGRLVVERLANSMDINFTESQGCMVAKNSKIWLVYSMGYMNNSGEPLAKLIRYFKIDTNHPDFQVLVIQDDSDQNIGNSKLTCGGGSAGHNGIISIYKQLESLYLSQLDIWRLKIGIRPINNKQKSETFVLSKIDDEEVSLVKQLSELLLNNYDFILTKNLPRLQNKFNIKNTPKYIVL